MKEITTSVAVSPDKLRKLIKVMKRVEIFQGISEKWERDIQQILIILIILILVKYYNNYYIKKNKYLTSTTCQFLCFLHETKLCHSLHYTYFMIYIEGA